MRALVSRLDRIAGRVDELPEHTADLATQTADLAGQVSALSAQVAELQRAISDEVQPVLRAVAAEESLNRRRLAAVRASPDYGRAWEIAEPLVTVTIPTRDRVTALIERALPSVLRQSHHALEVIVVGDAAGPELEAAVLAVAAGDPRVRWANLTQRVAAHPDPRRHWLVASGMARNEAARLARGEWILHFDDDDALRPGAIATLLERARETRAEAVYGAFERQAPDGSTERFGSWPPGAEQMGWQGALHHAALPFERELVAAHLGIPGDAWLLERMLRAGVRFAMADEVVWDYYPSTLWEPERDA